MPKKASEKQPHFTDEELAAMTPAQKLQRVADIEREIDGQKARIKDEAAAARDLIKEMNERKSELLKGMSTSGR